MACWVVRKIKKIIDERIHRWLTDAVLKRSPLPLKIPPLVRIFRKNVVNILENLSLEPQFSIARCEQILYDSLLKSYAKKKSSSLFWPNRLVAARIFNLFPACYKEPELFKLLQDNHTSIQFRAMDSILRHHFIQGLDQVLQVIGSSPTFPRIAYLDLLTQQSAFFKEDVIALIRSTKDEGILHAGLDFLTMIHHPIADFPLESFLLSPDLSKQQSAICLIDLLDDLSSLEKIKPHLVTWDRSMACQLIEVLSRKDSTSCISILLALIEHPSLRVQTDAAKILVEKNLWKDDLTRRYPSLAPFLAYWRKSDAS